MDLGANEYVTFFRITLPLIAPGHPRGRAARLLPLDRRLRDHQLQLGHDDDVPALRLEPAQRGVPPEVNVIGTMIFGVAILLMLGNVLCPVPPDPKGAA